MGTLRVPVTQHDHVLGPTNASVTLVEYGDYECPYCGAAFPIVNRILQHFGPKLRYVFRHFPLTQVHPNLTKDRAVRAVLMFLALGFALFAARAAIFADCIASNC